MNILSVIIIGYIIVASLLIYIILRDKKNKSLFFGHHDILASFTAGILFLGIIIAFYARFIEPFNIVPRYKEVKVSNLSSPIKIALIADPQLNYLKNFDWANKINKKISEAQPDLVIFDGDLIDNEGNTYQLISASKEDSSEVDETGLLYGFRSLPEKYPTYFTLGNHEYGLGNLNRTNPLLWQADRATDVKNVMEAMKVKSLVNKLECPTIKQQKICLFGVDDIWGAQVGETKISFDDLKNWDQTTPLIFVVHNPDGILAWPKNIKKPSLVVAGHTHGGQVYLPLIGPIGNAGMQLGKQYYRGLNYYEGTPIYTSVGLGESGGLVRFMAAPELSVITLTP